MTNIGKIDGILGRIIESKRPEIETARRDLASLKSRAKDRRPALDFVGALDKGDGIPAIIAEIKKASPSKGLICPDFDPLRIACDYRDGGASAISVITEKNFFQGSIDYIDLLRPSVEIPLLCKDFIVSEAQIVEARAHGADSFLLICAALDKESIRGFLSLGREHGMEALVETHDEEELETALEAGAGLIGVNSRNLKTFDIDLGTALRLAPMIPERLPGVAESGIFGAKEARLLRDAGYKAFLVGESLMKSGKKHELIRELSLQQ